MARDSSSALTSCFRWLLFVFNFVVFCSGIVLAALGAWILIDSWWFLSLRHNTLIDDDGNDNNFNGRNPPSNDKNSAVMLMSTPGELNSHISPANTFMHIACYVMICTGVLVALVAFLGCLSAMANARALLTIYLTLLLAAICMEIFAATYVMSRQPYRGADQVLRETLRVTLQKAYLGDEYVQGQDRSAELNLVTMAWNELMMKLQCCGVNGSRDFVYDRLPQGYRANGNLPVVCCKLKEHGRKRPFSLEPLDTQCQALPNNENSYMRTGCYRALWDWLSSTAITILIATASVVLVQIVAICITCCLLVSGGWISRHHHPYSSTPSSKSQPLLDGIIHTQTRDATDDEEAPHSTLNTTTRRESEVANGSAGHITSSSTSSAKTSKVVLVTAANNTNANESEKIQTFAAPALPAPSAAVRPAKPPKPAGLVAGVTNSSAASLSPKINTTTFRSATHTESTGQFDNRQQSGNNSITLTNNALASRLASHTDDTSTSSQQQQQQQRGAAVVDTSKYRIQDNPSSQFVLRDNSSKNNDQILIEDFAIDDDDVRHFESEKQRFMTTPTMTTKMLHAKISGSGINSPLLSGIRHAKTTQAMPQRNVDDDDDYGHVDDEDKQPMLSPTAQQPQRSVSSRASSVMGGSGIYHHHQQAIQTIPVINDRKVTTTTITTTTARGGGASSVTSSSPRAPRSMTAASQQQQQRMQIVAAEGVPPAWKRNGTVMPEFSL